MGMILDANGRLVPSRASSVLEQSIGSIARRQMADMERAYDLHRMMRFREVNGMPVRIAPSNQEFRIPFSREKR